MKIRCLLLLVLSFLILTLSGCFSVEKKSGHLITLANDSLKIILAPRLGARLVYFGHPDGPNFLKVDEDVWQPHTWPDSIHVNMPFKGYHGMITWLGPQSDWWIHQELVQERKTAKAIWPPDPFLIYGDFQVVRQTDSSVILSGPYSPVSGIVMKKAFWLNGNSLQIEVEIENVSNDTIGWDIWTNSRFDVNTKYCIPLKKTEDKIRIEDSSENVDDSLQYHSEDGCFSFLLPSMSESENAKYKAKAFIHGCKGQIVVFKESQKLLINFDEEEETRIHSEHGFVEVYVSLTGDDANNLLELEHHSAYQMLAPGEIMRKKQGWVLEQIVGNH